MAKERLLERLLRIRELGLKAEAAALQERAHALSRVEATLEQARSAASESIETPRHLHELGALGELRLACRKTAEEIVSQVDEGGRRVMRARRLTQLTRHAHERIERSKEAARERTAEAESEQFFAWQKNGAR
jgi:hypothetical protein